MSKDEILAQGIRRGDESIIREFVGTYTPRLMVFLVRFGLPEADREEITVSTLSDVVVKISAFEPRGEGSFRNWVYSLAHNLMCDWLREKALLGQLHASPGDLAARSVEGPAPELHPDLQDALDRAFRALTDREQACVYMRTQREPYSFKEIAAELGITEGNARVICSRAMAKLRRLAPLHLRERPARASPHGGAASCASGSGQ